MMAGRFRWSLPIAVAAGVFGVVTIVAGGRVLFGSAMARQEAGNYVEAVVWFNFLAGFVYIAAAVELARGRRVSAWLATALAAATALVFAAFCVWVLVGGAYEMRTVMALAFRTLVWAGIAVFGCRAFGARSYPEVEGGLS